MVLCPVASVGRYIPNTKPFILSTGGHWKCFDYYEQSNLVDHLVSAKCLFSSQLNKFKRLLETCSPNAQNYRFMHPNINFQKSWISIYSFTLLQRYAMLPGQHWKEVVILLQIRILVIVSC